MVVPYLVLLSSVVSTKRYFFMARDMNIKAMDETASKIVGSHDFRNLCKIGTCRFIPVWLVGYVTVLHDEIGPNDCKIGRYVGLIHP